MKIRMLLVLTTLVLILAACGAGASTSIRAPTLAAAPTAAPAAADGNAAGAPIVAESSAARAPEPGQPQAGQAAAQQPADTQRLVIKTAQMTVQVEDVAAAEANLRARIGELQGYIVTSQSNGTAPNMTIELTFRVPSSNFDAALSGVQGLAKKVVSRTLGGEDVTQEYVDLESRLRNLEATRDRLLTLLQKADKVEDALAVNQALTDVQGQVEQAKGRMEYLKKSSAFSTITVSMLPVPVSPPIIEEGWQPFQVAKDAARGLVEFGQGLVEFLIVLLVWIPVWLPIVLLLRWGWRWMTRRNKKPAVAATTAEPQAPTAAS